MFVPFCAGVRARLLCCRSHHYIKPCPAGFASDEPGGRMVRPRPIVEVAFVLDTTGSMGR